MGCCGSRALPVSLQQVQEVLVELPTVFPGTKVSCVIHEEGHVVSKHAAESVSDEDLVSLVSNVKQAALQFASVLNQKTCPRIHIKGAASLYSCYDVGPQHVLALFTDMHGTRMESFDMERADKRMAPLLRRVRDALDSTPSSSSSAAQMAPEGGIASPPNRH